MKTFYQWAEAKKYTLPELSENTKRGGIHTAYPAGYVRSQYPDGYFPPVSGTAFLDLKNQEKVVTKAPAA